MISKPKNTERIMSISSTKPLRISVIPTCTTTAKATKARAKRMEKRKMPNLTNKST
ncbi:Uncharacterised protein [Vibrio cholerae]|nr:Uncharacterised protein [Vibrio cholerae]